MQNFKYVVFWLLFFVLGVAVFHDVPLNEVGKPFLIIFPMGFILWIFIRSRSNRSVFRLPPDLSSRFHASRRQSPHDLQAHSELVSMCMGDIGAVERLIQFELRKLPGLTRAQATRAARDRLAYDRGRTH